jgi:hypothetical protein
MKGFRDDYSLNGAKYVAAILRVQIFAAAERRKVMSEIKYVENIELLRNIARYASQLKQDEIVALVNDLVDETKLLSKDRLQELGRKVMKLDNALIICCFIEFCMSNGINPDALQEENEWSLMRVVARVKNALMLGKVAA